METTLFIVTIFILFCIIVINSYCVRCYQEKKNLKPLHIEGHHFFKDYFRQHYFESV